ncbi:DNRLRE domain-containing protein [Clostridiaceae bacterium M8S5]|nr:DNRLRE domain-containing protein [Clostridiaceae bacterium M8S5]
MKELIIYPTKDAMVSSNNKNQNYGKDHNFFIGISKGKSVYNTYLQFELPSLKSHNKVEKIELNIYIMKNENKEVTKKYKVIRLIDSFDENKITYQNELLQSDPHEAYFEIKDELDKYIKIDVTKLYKASINKNEFIMEIKPLQDSEKDCVVGFYSKDSNEIKFYPYIRMTFSAEDKNLADMKADNEIITKYFNLGSKMYYKKDYKKAMEYYIQLLKVFDREAKISPVLLYRSCICYIELGMYVHAYKLSNEALRIYENLPELYYVRGLLNIKQCELLKAKTMFETYLKLQKKSPKLYQRIGSSDYLANYYLGEIHYETESYEKSFEYYIKSVKINPRFKKAYSKIVEILLLEDRDIGYIEELLLRLKMYETKENVICDLVEVLIDIKKYVEAGELLRKINQKNKKAMYLEGVLLMRIKKYEDAINKFNSIDNLENIENAGFDKILCYLYLNQIDKAKEVLYKISFNYTKKSLVYRLLVYSVFDKNTKITNKILIELEKKSNGYEEEIYNLLDKILATAGSEIFDDCLYLTEFIDNDEVLLRLGKLFYKHKLYLIALSEFVRSIKEYNHIDKEGLYIMKKCLIKLETN